MTLAIRWWLAGATMVLTPLAACGQATEEERPIDPDMKPVVEANTAFAFALYAELARSSPGENVFFSPYSVSSALTMTWEGARNETARQMADVLGWSATPAPSDHGPIHEAFGRLNSSLEADGESYDLTIANALWGEQTFPFSEAFLRAVTEPHGAALSPVDFRRAPEPSRLQINAWVEQRTQGRIKDLLPQGVIDGVTRLVLTNAIYFKGRWVEQFDAKLTRERPFHLGDGTQVAVPMMMNQDVRVPFGFVRPSWSQNPVRLVRLPYQGEHLSMVVLLPDRTDGLPTLERHLTTELLGTWLDRMREQYVDLQLPRFRLETSFMLKEHLQKLGITAAFSPQRANFSGMSDSAEQLYLHEVVHKAFVQVDEEGTEAAAATGAVMRATSMPPSFVADHPFLFMIRDDRTGAILFMGRVADPTRD